MVYGGSTHSISVDPSTSIWAFKNMVKDRVDRNITELEFNGRHAWDGKDIQYFMNCLGHGESAPKFYAY